MTNISNTPNQPALAAGTGSSIVVKQCQVCGNPDLQSVLFLGYLPPVNQMHPVGEKPREQPSYPAEMLYCPQCQLVQLGLIVDPKILFAPDYPYTSGTTRILRENFAEMYREVAELYPRGKDDLIVDIGSNDGTLLSNFKNAGHRVLGIEPTLMAERANAQGITSMMAFFGRDAATQAVARAGKANLITATNVFAHIENIHDIVDSLLLLLDDKGIFISESHYLISLLETLQYDTIYHEHLRYYSLHSLQYLLNMHGLDVIHAKKIPTHGGSIRVYAARKGVYPRRDTVAAILAEEDAVQVRDKALTRFKREVVNSKMQLYALLADIKRKGERIYGIGAPSRASTLINYLRLDDGILDCVLEVSNSYKLNKYMPGTLIPVIDEARLFEDQPEYAMLLSWHIADELMPKLTAKGFKGGYIIPLRTPRVVRHSGS